MRWGILATGTIARKFAATVQQMEREGEQIVAVGSRRLESAKLFAEEYGVEVYYDSYEQLAQDPNVDVIYIATPNNMHYENCKTCLLNGKHVLCEKPFTITVEQARELYDLAEERGIFLMEALWIRFLPLYERLHTVIAEGRIGELRQLESAFGFIAEGSRKERKFKSELGGGALLDIGIYNLGFLQMMTGKMPEKFESEVNINEYGTDDYSKITLMYSDGCIGKAEQAIGRELERNAIITGTKGSVFLEDFQFAKSMTIRYEDGREEKMDFPMDINGFEYQIRETSKCIQAGKFFSDRYTPEESLSLTKLMYDIRMSWNMKFEGEK